MIDSKTINCPNCSVAMNEVKTSSHYGAIVVLDQCPHCGGIWFDELEMYQVKHGKADKIEKKLNEEKLRDPVQLKEEDMHCPKDGSRLRQFQDINFPKTIIVESCQQCGGFWFNRGEFTRFQHERSKRLKKIEEKNNDVDLRKIRAMLEVHAIGAKNNQLDTLGRLGSFLSQPVYGTSLLNMTTDPELAAKRMNNKVQSSELMNAIWTLVNILLRILVFRR